MNGTVRLILISHAQTNAMRTASFPTDEPLNLVGLRDLGKGRGLVADADRAHAVLTASETRAVQTAEGLGITAQPVPALRDLDYGEWAGREMEQVPHDQLLLWLTDPTARPHGGESVTDVIGRVRAWTETISATPRRTLAVTHPAVIRAAILIALHAPAESFWRIDIAPLSRTVLHHRGPGWTLRSLSPHHN